MLDTNIVLYYVGGLQEIQKLDANLAISTLTLFEVLRYPCMGREEDQNLRHFLNRCARLSVTDEIAERASFLNRSRSIGSIDLLIAATALEYDLPLVTKNTKDFRDIKGLKLLESI